MRQRNLLFSKLLICSCTLQPRAPTTEKLLHPSKTFLDVVVAFSRDVLTARVTLSKFG